MQRTYEVKCSVDEQGVLSPIYTVGPATIVKTVLAEIFIDAKFEDEPITGRIIWNNSVKAFITFDTTGERVAGYHITDMTLNSEATRQSVENLLRCISC